MTISLKSKRAQPYICYATLSHFSRVWLCVTPQTAAHQAPPSLRFSRQEHWGGLPFPSPMHESEKWKRSCSVVSDSWRPHGLQPSRLLHLWDFPGKSTGVGCHCLLRALYIHVSIFPQVPLPSRLPHNIEQSSMCYTVGPCWLSILNIAVCVYDFPKP